MGGIEKGSVYSNYALFYGKGISYLIEREMQACINKVRDILLAKGVRNVSQLEGCFP